MIWARLHSVDSFIHCSRSNTSCQPIQVPLAPLQCLQLSKRDCPGQKFGHRFFSDAGQRQAVEHGHRFAKLFREKCRQRTVIKPAFVNGVTFFPRADSPNGNAAVRLLAENFLELADATGPDFKPYWQLYGSVRPMMPGPGWDSRETRNSHFICPAFWKNASGILDKSLPLTKCRTYRQCLIVCPRCPSSQSTGDATEARHLGGIKPDTNKGSQNGQVAAQNFRVHQVEIGEGRAMIAGRAMVVTVASDIDLAFIQVNHKGSG